MGEGKVDQDHFHKAEITLSPSTTNQEKVQCFPFPPTTAQPHQ